MKLERAHDGFACVEDGRPAEFSLSIGGTRLFLCAETRRELRNLLGRARKPRPLNNKQYTALKTIANAGGQARQATIVRAMGRYATNSFKSCVARELIRSADGELYELTPKGSQLLAQLEARL